MSIHRFLIVHVVYLVLAAASPARAQVSLVGDWSSRVHDVLNDPQIGDFGGLGRRR